MTQSYTSFSCVLNGHLDFPYWLILGLYCVDHFLQCEWGWVIILRGDW
jgi:hypothetical protein